MPVLPGPAILHASSVRKYGIPGFASFLCINRDINSRNKRIGRAPRRKVEESGGDDACVALIRGFFPRDRETAPIPGNEINSVLSVSLSILTSVHIKLRGPNDVAVDTLGLKFIYLSPVRVARIYYFAQAKRAAILMKLRNNCAPFFAGRINSRARDFVQTHRLCVSVAKQRIHYQDRALYER